MSVIHVEFLRAGAQVVPIARYFPSGETEALERELDRRHRIRWYRLGAAGPATARFWRWAGKDGPQFQAAYRAGVMALAFGVDLTECVL